MKKNYLMACTVTVLTIVLISFSLFNVVANAQYQSQETANVTIGSNGAAHIDQSSTGGVVSVDLAGAPGTTGSVSTATYIANPQPDASSPASTTLSNFVVITFNVPAANFYGANIVFHYNDATVAGITPPYTLYKYDATSNTYVLQNAVVDTNAKTITLSITSLSDPLFAIGGTSTATKTTSGFPVLGWALIVIIIVVVIILAVLIVRRHNESPFKVIEPEE